MPVRMRDIDKFKLNNVCFGGEIVSKSTLLRGYYGQSKHKFFLEMTVSDIPENLIILVIEEESAVYVHKHFKIGDFITVTGHLESNVYHPTKIHLRVTQVAFPVYLHEKKINQEMRSIEHAMNIEEMMKESEE